MPEGSFTDDINRAQGAAEFPGQAASERGQDDLVDLLGE
jgi:hypothetical protein